MRKRLIPLVLATVLFAGLCRNDPAIVDTVAPVLDTGRLYYDDSPAFTDSLRQVVKDLAAWRDVWNTATSTQPSPPRRPVIDFNESMVVVVAAGRMSPGDWIRVDSAGERNNLFKVYVRTVVECQRFRADAYPFEIVRVRRSDAPIDWVDRQEEAENCRR